MVGEVGWSIICKEQGSLMKNVPGHVTFIITCSVKLKEIL